MTQQEQNHKDHTQSSDHHRDRRDERDKELSPDMDFPKESNGTGGQK